MYPAALAMSCKYIGHRNVQIEYVSPALGGHAGYIILYPLSLFSLHDAAEASNFCSFCTHAESSETGRSI
jgi:hypothetical protein